VGDAISLVELLAQLAGAELSFRRESENDLLAVTILVLPTGRQLLFVERTYRDGTRVLLDPTPEDIEIARSGNLWSLWNEERTRLLAPASWAFEPLQAEERATAEAYARHPDSPDVAFDAAVWEGRGPDKQRE
jgi:hypothetical protein